MDWSKGFSARYRLVKVDPSAWADTETLDFTSGNVTRDSSALMQSADVELTKSIGGYEAWIRVYLDAEQGSGNREQVPLFTGLACVPTRSLESRRETYSVECYSVLKPVNDVILDRGWFAAKGAVVVDIVRDLLKVTPAPISFEEGSPRLDTYVLAEDGETNLSMAQYLLSLISWEIFISGDGRIVLRPIQDRVAAMFNSIKNDVIGINITDTINWYSCPNVFRAVSDVGSAVAVDDDENSPLSIVNRGREVWMEETNCILNSGETLQAYAERRLAEEQAPVRTFSYTRRFDPNVFPGDLVDISYPAADFNGLFRVTSQTITLGYSGEVQEEAILVS